MKQIVKYLCGWQNIIYFRSIRRRNFSSERILLELTEMEPLEESPDTRPDESQPMFGNPELEGSDGTFTVKGNMNKHHKNTDKLCGAGHFRPNCIQSCAGIRSFVAVFSICSLLSQVLSLYIASQITAIEKQFGLTSFQSGFLLSCNDIGFLSATLAAGYMASRVHIPRCFAFSLIVYGVGGLICSLAFVISRDTITEQSKEFLNFVDGNKAQHQRVENSSYSFQSEILVTNTSFYQTSLKVPLCEHVAGDVIFNGSVNSLKEQDCGSQTLRSTFGSGLPNKHTSGAIAIIAFGKDPYLFFITEIIRIIFTNYCTFATKSFLSLENRKPLSNINVKPVPNTCT